MRIAIAPDLLQNESFPVKWVARLEELGHHAELRELGKRLMAALDHCVSYADAVELLRNTTYRGS